MFSMLVPVKVPVMTFRGEMICEDILAVVALFFSGSEGLVGTPRLDDFCLLVAGFFIEAKKGFAKRVESGYLISTQITDFRKFRASYYYASLIPIRQSLLVKWAYPYRVPLRFLSKKLNPRIAKNVIPKAQTRVDPVGKS